MKFVTLFLRLKNVHLLKDVGMIPYYLMRDHGLDSTMVCMKNEDEYSFIDKEVKGLKIRFLPENRYSPVISGMKYVWDNARDIDVLNVYHLNLSSFLLLLIYKLRKKRGGRGYLKLDMDLKGYKRLYMFNPVGFIKRRTMNLADIISVETTMLYDRLKKRYGSKMIYIPNGFYATGDKPERNFEKKNMILTVGNLGTYAKATDILLQAFAGVAGDNDWVLTLVGPVEPSFRKYVSEFLSKHEELRKRIIFTGEIRDKEKLMEYYKKAKIFVLPSRSESFGIVLLEAASNGDFMVTTTGVPAGRDIFNDGKYGFIVPPEDPVMLSDAFIRLMNSKADWSCRAAEIADYAWHDFRWEPIVSRLYEVLKN